MLKKCPSDKINVTKNALFLFARAPTQDSFTSYLQFLYGLKHGLSLKNCVWDFSFSIPPRLYFCSTKIMDSLPLKRNNSFQNKKSHTQFCSQTSDF